MPAGKKTIKNRILAGLLSTTLAASVLGGVVYYKSNEVYARPTLRGIEELAEGHSQTSADTAVAPFTIIEVVPSLSDAKFGYLVGGEEPIYQGKSLKDMPSKDERVKRMEETDDKSSLDIYDSAFKWKTEEYRYKEPDTFSEDDEAVKVTMDIKGDFNEVERGFYDINGITEDYKLYEGEVEDIYGDNNPDGIVLYHKSIAYRNASGYTGAYNFNLRRVNADMSMPITAADGVYNFQYFVANEVAVDTEFGEGIILYSCPKDADLEYLEYVGMVQAEDDHFNVLTADGSVSPLNDYFADDSAYNYYSVQEASELNDDVFIIDGGIRDGGAFGSKDGYSRVEGDVYSEDNASKDKGPYYVATGESTDEYAFTIDDAGDPAGKFDFTADYSKTDVYQTVNYMGGFTNSEWFKREVLDRDEGTECDQLIVDVIPVTLDKLGDYLDKADLVYFAGGYTNDIEPGLAMNLVNKVVEDDLPVILEYSTLSVAEEKGHANLQKMALSLMQVAIKKVADSEAWENLNYSDKDGANYLWKTVRFYNNDPDKMDPRTNDISYVSGTIFVNDDICDGSSKVVAADFNETYPKAKRESGFNDIQAECESERTYIELYGDWSKFNANISKATSIRYILNKHKNRTVVKSELNILDIEPFATSQYKDQKVLEENIYNAAGVDYSGRYALTRDTMTSEWMVTNLTPHLLGKEEQIHIKQQGTKEFIGKNEDLNSTYDMIYIGMDTAIMNTEKVNNQKSVSTIYNFSWYGNKLFDKHVYLHVGDRIPTLFNVRNEGNEDEAFRHLAGNDITSDKLRELKEYIEAGYAVILSDGFFVVNGNSVAINSATLDSSSNMHKLISQVVLAKDDSGNYRYYGKSVFRRGELEKESINCERARSTISKYLNISKLTIKVKETPPEYKGVDEPNYIPTNSDGSHTMRFVVELTNDAAVDASKTSYDCKLYLDMDADGKYEENEALGGIEVDGSSAERFELKSGNTYTITRNAPDEYVGFLSWKLAFIQNERETSSEATALNNVRSSITGYSAIRNEGDRPTIKVLQIGPNDSSLQNLDLSVAGSMKEYYDQVRDFNIEVDQVTVGDYIQKKFTNGKITASKLTYYDFLAQYDMVVIGFADAFNFYAEEKGDNIEVTYPVWWTSQYNNGNNPQYPKSEVYRDAVFGIREYALSGRSILFTHDLTSRRTFKEVTVGYYANMYLRDIMGMDRYNKLNISNLNYYNDYELRLEEYATTLSRDALKAMSREYKIPDYKSEYDELKVDGNEARDGKNPDGPENFGFTDAAIVTFADRAKMGWGLTTRQITHDYNLSAGATKYANKMETVTAVNEGQITRYPFLITEGTSGEGDKSSFDVSSTHSQYFQLNLDTNSRDSNTDDDVVVWYAISNNGSTGDQYTSLHEYYQAIYNDVRNNYYIYSKGNVTYTGAGHDPISGAAEKKLFVNTLVASYNSGLHAPKVVFKENPWDGAANVSSTCIPYDPKLTNNEALTDADAVAADEGGFIDDTLKINFKTLNNNFRDSGSNLYAEYYMADTEGDTVIDGIRYKRLYPSLKVDNGNGSLGDVDANVLVNYHVYQAKFKISDLKLSNGNKLAKENSKIYVRLSTVPFTGSDRSTANESMNAIDITTIKLFDLK